MPLLCCSRIISVSRSRLVYGLVSTLYLAQTSTGVLPRSKESKEAVNKCVVYGQRLFSLGFCSLPGLFIVPDDYNTTVVLTILSCVLSCHLIGISATFIRT